MIPGHLGSFEPCSIQVQRVRFFFGWVSPRFCELFGWLLLGMAGFWLGASQSHPLEPSLHILELNLDLVDSHHLSSSFPLFLPSFLSRSILLLRASHNYVLNTPHQRWQQHLSGREIL